VTWPTFCPSIPAFFAGEMTSSRDEAAHARVAVFRSGNSARISFATVLPRTTLTIPRTRNAPKDIDARVRHLIARRHEGRFRLTSLLSILCTGALHGNECQLSMEWPKSFSKIVSNTRRASFEICEREISKFRNFDFWKSNLIRDEPLELQGYEHQVQD